MYCNACEMCNKVISSLAFKSAIVLDNFNILYNPKLDDDTIIIGHELMDGLDKELDDFIDNLLKTE